MNGRKYLIHSSLFCSIHVTSVCNLPIIETRTLIENCLCESGVLSLSALSTSSVYLGHYDELHWFNESRAHNCLSETCNNQCICVCRISFASTIFLHWKSYFKTPSILMSENRWIQATCYLDDLNQMLHALLQNTNSPLTAHEPISNVLGWWIPVLGPMIHWGLRPFSHPAPTQLKQNTVSWNIW